MMLRLKLCVVSTVLITVMLSMPSWANYRPRISMAEAGKEASIVINGKSAIRFKVSNGSLTPKDRATITLQRLNQLVDAGFKPGTLSVKSDKSLARIYAGETLICVVTPADASANRMTAQALANTWVSNMRTLLLMPPVKLSVTELLVPLGENRSVTVEGVASGPISVKASDESVAAFTSNDSSRQVQVTGQKLGSTQVEVSVAGERAVMTVVVRKFAGRVSDVAYAQVTGNPCPSGTVSYAARQAVMRSITSEPGAKIELGEVDAKGGALGKNNTRRVDVSVRITGEGYIPYAGKATVEISNVSMPSENVQELFYSNHPERLLKYQTLYAGKLELNKATRMLFHHQNGMGKRAHFVIELINPNPTPATFRVFRGVSNPLVDTVLVGYIATLEFMKSYTNEVSVMETVPPMSRLILVSDMLAHNETTSGVLEMRQTMGGGTYIRVLNNEPGVDNVSRGQVAEVRNPMAMELSDHVYSSPIKTINAEYVIGQRWAFISIGKHALTDTTEQKRLYGNYGVTYNIDVKLENPTDQTKKVVLAFDATAGLASGVFMIDGAFVAHKYAKPPDDYPLVTYTLKPGEIRNVRVMTLPVAGSNYPAALVVRS